MSAAIGIKRLGLAVAGLLAAAVALLLVLTLVIPADTVREAVQAQIRTVTGLDPVLRGDVSVSLFPRGTVRFNDVSLGDNRTGAAALSAEQLLVRLRFLPFLIGRIEIADVTLVRPVITISFASDGSSNWAGHIETLARDLTPSPDRVKTFSEIRIRDGTVILRDDAFKIVETLTDVEFALAWPSISRSFAATGQFNWKGEAFDGSISLTDFLAALTGDRSGLKVRLAGTPFKVAFDGNISHEPALRLEGVLAADTGSLRETMHWATGATESGSGLRRFALKSSLTVLGRSISLSKANIELDGNSGEGVLTYVATGRQSLQGTLAVEGLDLTPYSSAFRILTADRNWSRLPLELEALNGIDIDIRISAARVNLETVTLGRTAVAANLRNGNLTLAIGESEAFGGILKGSLAISKSTAGADLQAELQFNDVLLDQSLGALLGIRRVEGKGDISLSVSGAGRSIYELTKALNGSVTLVSRKGSIAGVNVEQSLKRLEQNPLAARGSDFRGGKTSYDELSVHLKVTNGTAQVEEIRVETPAMRVGVAGTTSIPARNFNLKGTASLLASAASDTVPAFQLPFVVLGTWDDPLFWPDIKLLIQRSGAAAPLLDAVRNRLERNRAPELAGESAPPPAPPAAENTLTPQ